MTHHVLVIGPPRVGKTTFALALGAKTGTLVRHTDDLIGSHAWSDASDEVARWLDEDTPAIIEGVAVVRALRKWLKANPEGKPASTIYLRTEPREPLTPKQSAMGRGVMTIWHSIAADVRARGVTIDIF